MTKVGVGFDVDTSELESAFSKMAHLGNQGGKQLAADIGKQVKGAAQGSQKAAQKVTKSWARVGTVLESAKRGAEGLGGALGENAGKLEAFSQSLMGLAGALGPVSAVVVAGTAAIAGLGLAAAGSAIHAIELQEELKELGRESVIDAEGEKGLRELEHAMSELSASTKELVVIVGADFAPALADMVTALGQVVDAGGEAYEAMKLFSRVVMGIGTLGASEVARFSYSVSGVGEAVDEWGESTREAERMAGRLGETVLDARDEMVEFATSAFTAADAAEVKRESDAKAAKAAREHAKAVATQEAALTRLQAIAVQAQGAQLEGAEKIRFELEQQHIAIAELEKASGDHAAAATARAAVEANAKAQLREIEHADWMEKRDAQVARDIAALEKQKEMRIEAYNQAIELDNAEKANKKKNREDAARAAIQSTQAIAAAAEMAFEHQQQMAEAAHQTALDNIAELRDEQADLHERLKKATTEEEKRRIKAEIAKKNATIRAEKSIAAEKKRQALAAFRAQKALALVQIAVATSVAIMQAIAQLGPVAGAIAAVGIGVTAGVQAGLVAKQKPPQLHAGGMVEAGSGFQPYSGGADEVPVTARAGEAMLNQRAVDRQGGRRAVEAMNRAQGPSGATYHLHVDGRTVAAGVAEHMHDAVGDYARDVGGIFPGQAPVFGV